MSFFIYIFGVIFWQGNSVCAYGEIPHSEYFDHRFSRLWGADVLQEPVAQLDCSLMLMLGKEMQTFSQGLSKVKQLNRWIKPEELCQKCRGRCECAIVECSTVANQLPYEIITILDM